MHATTEQLLSLRDGRPVDAAAAAHMAECPQCRQAVRGMMRLRARLRELPELDPPPDLWQTIALQAPAARAAPEPPGHTPWYWPVGVGIAAACALTVALVLNVGQAPDDGPAPGTTTDLIAATPAPMSSVNGVTTAELLETSRQLETALRVMPAAPQVTRASTALTIAELQDRIFQVDTMLSEPELDPASEQELWRQRVRLMDTLMQVRYAQLAESR